MIELRNNQTEEMRRAKSMEEMELLCPLQGHLTHHLLKFTIPDAPQTLSFEDLWRLHLVGMIDQIIDHWGSSD